MQLEKLEALKNRYGAYSSEIDSFKDYLFELEGKHINTIEPNILSKRLKIPFREAIRLLSIAEKSKILRKGYQVFSLDDNFSLGEFRDTNEIPDTLLNPATGKYLGKDQFFVDLVFHFPTK